MLPVAIAQLNSNDQINRNIVQIVSLIEEAQKNINKPEIIFFPENSIFFRINQNQQLPQIDFENDSLKQLQEVSNQSKIQLHLTNSFYVDSSNWNASVLIRPNENIQMMYKKIHLFDISLLGQNPIRESDVYAGGSKPEIFNIKHVRFGSSICYDLRFSELFSYYAKNDVDVILVPAAFLVKTGIAHWEVLLRARAIESQCYILAPAQAGVHKNSEGLSRETYGHAMIIDPWGKIIESKSEGVGLLYTKIDTDLIKNVRQQIPMKSHRRL